MNWKQELSWKFLLPLGVVIYVLFYGGIFQLLGFICIVMGVIDFFRKKPWK